MVGPCSVDSSALGPTFEFLDLKCLRPFWIKMMRSSSASTIPTTIRPIEVGLRFDGHCSNGTGSGITASGSRWASLKIFLS